MTLSLSVFSLAKDVRDSFPIDLAFVAVLILTTRCNNNCLVLNGAVSLLPLDRHIQKGK